MSTIEITRGIGSSPKLWGQTVLPTGEHRMVFELDLPPAPITALFWDPARVADEPAATLGRFEFDSIEDALARLAELWPAVEIRQEWR